MNRCWSSTVTRASGTPSTSMRFSNRASGPDRHPTRDAKAARSCATRRRKLLDATAPSTCSTSTGWTIAPWTNLETYVAAGWRAGVLCRAAGRTSTSTTSSSIGTATGLFPLPLERDDLLDSDPIWTSAPTSSSNEPDHPVFRELVQGQNPIIRMMHVERYLRPPLRLVARPGERRAGAGPTCATARRWPSKRRFGKGRVIAVPDHLRSLLERHRVGPRRDPGPAARNRTWGSRGAYHAAGSGHRHRRAPGPRQISARTYGCLLPDRRSGRPLLIERPAEKLADSPRFVQADVPPAETQHSGIYEMWFTRVGRYRRRRPVRRERRPARRGPGTDPDARACRQPGPGQRRDRLRRPVRNGGH